MASINKLSIRGVRAFSPDDEEQVISFSFPLTIIVGANGCGKTTIIEALKYAVTGCLPPGNKSGQAFVHDPKSVGSSVVKASIKLRFTNRAGKSMVVIRSMEVTQKKTTMSFKALDGILRTTDEDGNRQSLSHKCTELDRQIPQLVGVSKSILEHVVFCHQEDSSWPLMEGAVLKKRFDDIFDSTKYVKALESIKDTRKSYFNQTKDLKAVVAELSGHKYAALGFRREFDKTQEQLSDITDEITKLNEKVTTSQDRQNILNQFVAKREDMVEDLHSLQNDIDKQEARIETQKDGLMEDLTLTHQEESLIAMIDGFEQTLKNDHEATQELERQARELKRQLEELRGKQHEVTRTKGRLEGEKKSYDQALMKRIQKIEQMGQKYGFDLSFTNTENASCTGHVSDVETSSQQSRFSAVSEMTSTTHRSMNTVTSTVQITDEDLRDINACIEKKKKQLEEELNEQRNLNQKRDDDSNLELTTLQAKISTIENDIKRLDTEKSNASSELGKTKYNSKIKPSQLEQARNDAAACIEKRDELMRSNERSIYPDKINEKEKELRLLTIEINEDSRMLEELRQYAEEQNEISILRKQLSKDEVDLKYMIENYNSYLIQKFTKATFQDIAHDVDSFHEEVDELFVKSEEKVTNSNEEVKSLERKYTEKSEQLKYTKKTMTSIQDKLSSLSRDRRGVQNIKNVIKDMIEFEKREGPSDPEVSERMDPQILLEKLSTRIATLSKEDDKFEAMARTIRKLKKMATTENSLVCPCCTRPMTLQSEIQTFSETMDNLADPEKSLLHKMIQSQHTRTERAIKQYEEWRKIVSRGINDYIEYNRLLKEEKTTKEKLQSLEEDASIAKNLFSRATEENKSLNDENGELSELLSFARQIKNDSRKIKEKHENILSAQSRIDISPSLRDKDLREVEGDFSDKQERKDAIVTALVGLQRKNSNMNEAISKRSAQASHAEKKLRELEMNMEQERKASQKRDELKLNIDKWNKEIDNLNKEILPLRSDLKTKETRRERWRAEAQEEERKKAGDLNQFNYDVEQFLAITTEIQAFEESGTLRRLQLIDSESASINQDIVDKSNHLNSVEPNLAKKKKRLQDQDGHRKNVQRNLDLLEMKGKLQKLQEKRLLMRQNLADFEAENSNFEDESKEVMAAIYEFKQKIDRLMGRKEALKSQQRDLKRKLQTTEYRDIDERHRVKMIEHETCQLTVQDLDLYHNALDKALLRYHGMKIEEINKIIQELWTLTYKGEDIRSIRLTSDQQSGSRASRSYNYRVVMTKGTTELDMRGRCSAGQRVLASIVIRLALAETFCLNCGVMALDEPTTNLDYANKRGLAIALAQIIASRAAQENFQLLIITHDEEFVGLMKSELSTHTGFDMPETYFHVSRQEGTDGSYYSKIRAIDWDDI